MNIGKMLILREIKEIGLLSAHSNLFMTSNLTRQPQGWALDDLETEDIIFNSRLELIASHFYNHILE